MLTAGTVLSSFHSRKRRQASSGPLGRGMGVPIWTRRDGVGSGGAILFMAAVKLPLLAM